MSDSPVFALSALLALVPLCLVFGRSRGRDAVFVSAVAVAVGGTGAFAVAQLYWGRLADLSTALWLGIAASMVLYAGLAAVAREAWRLAPPLAAYCLMLGIVAVLARFAPEQPLPVAPGAWLGAHIAVSLATYGLLTLAAVAGLAVALQEYALKSRRRLSRLTESLPSVADAEALQVRLLAGSAVVLAAGLLTGSAMEYLASGTLLRIDHKSVFSLLAFATIVALLVVHRSMGMRGRRAARVVLLAYLLLTLAYPGVKFVTQVLLAT